MEDFLNIQKSSEPNLRIGRAQLFETPRDKELLFATAMVVVGLPPNQRSLQAT